jgi:hypothetical protein
MFAMVLITFGVLLALFRSRVRAVRQGQVTTAYFKTYQGEVEPDATAKPARHFTNLFEAPTLFYVVCLAAMITHFTGLGMQLLAWAYVAARLTHAAVHIGSNRLRSRVRVYFLSWMVLLSMWIYLVFGIGLSQRY